MTRPRRGRESSTASSSVEADLDKTSPPRGRNLIFATRHFPQPCLPWRRVRPWCHPPLTRPCLRNATFATAFFAVEVSRATDPSSKDTKTATIGQRYSRSPRIERRRSAWHAGGSHTGLCCAVRRAGRRCAGHAVIGNTTASDAAASYLTITCVSWSPDTPTTLLATDANVISKQYANGQIILYNTIVRKMRDLTISYLLL